MIRTHVVSAVFWRNLKQYFSGVLGYLIIVVFVTVCAIVTFQPRFFADNLANLDHLSQWYPILLLFFIPAITMSVWADEKRRGTDALLFTLPASDVDILIGKYLAVSAVYTLALLFSTTQLIALFWIGDPDPGVIVATYFGYWLSGLALLAIGMFASSLTSDTTSAFVLGSIFCAIPVFGVVSVKILGLCQQLLSFLETYIPAFTTGVNNFFGWIAEKLAVVGIDLDGSGFLLERFGLPWNMADFTVGLIPLSNVVYFLSLIGVLLYLNLVVISRRHWSRGQQVTLGGHFFVRIVCLFLAVFAINSLVGAASAGLRTRLDLTSEKLYSLNETTIATLEKAKKDKRKVTIQAFISDEVPRKYANVKKQFNGLLRQYSLYGGNYVDVRYVDVKANSDEESQAKTLGLEPQDDRSDVGGRTVEQQVYLGAYVNSSVGDVAIPFLDGDSAIEYELSRAIAITTDKAKKKTLGIVDTDTFFAGPEIEGRRVEWEPYATTFKQLKQQYDIKHIGQDDLGEYIAPDQSNDENEKDNQGGENKSEDDSSSTKDNKVKDAPDVLLVPDPSSLSTSAMEALVKYIEAGNPTLILADPLPVFWAFQNPTRFGIINAPRQPRVNPQSSPYTHLLVSSFMPKDDAGKASKLLNVLGIDWDNGQAAWSLLNPHPGFQGKWPEYLGESWPQYLGPYEKAFVWVRPHAGDDTFNSENKISSGLKELLFFYPGTIRNSEGSKNTFTPLVKLGKQSGVTDWENLTQTPKRVERRLNPRTGRIEETATAASSQITGEDLIVIEPNPRSVLDQVEHVIAAQIQNDNGMNVVFISDLDFVSNTYYTQQEALGQKLDNMTLLQNAIEVLAGDDGFVELRNRRPTPRTLVRVEEETDKFRKERAIKEQENEKRVRLELEAEREKVNEAAKEIGENQSLNVFQKIQQTSQKAADAQRRFDIKNRRLEKELKREKDNLKAREQQQINSYESGVRNLSVLLAPLPALFIGIFVFFVRRFNENRNIDPERRV